MKWLLFFCLLIAVLIEGCAIDIKPSMRHDLGVPINVANGQTATNPVINVTAPTWFLDTRIHYRLLYSAPTTLRVYQLDSWIAPPPELLQYYFLAAGLKLSAPLTIRLLDFEQVFTDSKTAHVILRFVAEYGGNERVASISREFKLVQACQSADAAGATTAFSDLAQRAVSQLSPWLLQSESGKAVNLHQ